MVLNCWYNNSKISDTGCDASFSSANCVSCLLLCPVVFVVLVERQIYTDWIKGTEVTRPLL